MKRTGLARKNSRSSASFRVEASRRRLRSHYVLCIRNQGFPVSLERKKVYRRIPDDSAARRGLIRVIDESGQGYLYPKNCFVSISLPKAATRKPSPLK